MTGWDLYDLIKQHYSHDVVAEIWQDIRQTSNAARERGDKYFIYRIKPCYTFKFEVLP